MESLNRTEIQGTLGRISTTMVGDKLHANFSVATNYAYKDANGNAIVETTWHRISAFEGEKVKAETLNDIREKYAKNRDFVYVRVVGRLRQIRYVDTDGVSNSTYEIRASEVEILK